MKRVLQDGKSSQGQGNMVAGEDGTTESQVAALVGHADGIEAGSGPASYSSSSARSKGLVPASGAPDGDDDTESQTQQRVTAIPNYSEREEQVVRLSKRLLNIFYFCGTIFAGPYSALLTPPPFCIK
jgi:hypothetical protein